MLFGLLSQTTSLAQLPQFKSYDLPSNHPPTCILQDQIGYMWFGCKDGLYRFNGINWVSIKESRSGKTAPITCLTQTSNGEIWVGHADGQISYIEAGKFHPFQPDEGTPQVPIKAIAEDDLGQVWIATYGEGLYCFRNNRLYNFNSDDGLSSNDIYDMVVLDSTAWVGTDDGLLACSWKENEKNIINFGEKEGLTDGIVLSLAANKNGDILMGTHDGGLFQLSQTIKSSTLKRQIVPIGPSKWEFGPVTAIQPTSGNKFWVGTQNQGLILLEEGHHRAVIPNDNGHIQDFFLDPEGNLWIACEVHGLLSTFLGLDFLTLSSSKIYALYAGDPGHIYYSIDQGLYQFDIYKQESELIFPTSAYPVISIEQDKKGNLWLGTFGAGLYGLNSNLKTIAHYTIKQGMSDNNVFSMIRMGDSLWCATLGGLSCVDVHDQMGNAKIYQIIGNNGITFNYVYKIFKDNENHLWLGTDGNGLLKYDLEKFEGFLSGKTIFAISEDKEGHIWASTDKNEVFHEDPDGFRLIVPESNHSIRGIIHDGKGGMFTLGNRKIFHLDGDGKKVRDYDESLGLEGITPSLNTWVMDENGKLWVGTNNGIIGLETNAVAQVCKPTLYLKPPKGFTDQGALLTDVVLRYDQNHVTFDYFGFWYQAPEIVSYRHMLVGLDTGWVETHTPRAIYSKLNPGTYTFRVQLGQDGKFDNEISREINFKIDSPFWQKAWFIALGGVLFIGLCVLVLRLYESGKLKKERLDRERAEFQFEILRSQINPHFLFNSFNTLIDMIESEEKERAALFTEKLSDIFRTVLFYHKQSTIPLREELAIMEEYYRMQKYRFGEGLILRINIDKDKQEDHIPPLTLQLLLENAVKHNIVSTQNPLLVEIELDEKSPFLIIKNNLQERKTKASSSGIGLQNIINRYRLLTRQEVEIQVSAFQYLIRIPLIKHE